MSQIVIPENLFCFFFLVLFQITLFSSSTTPEPDYDSQSSRNSCLCSNAAAIKMLPELSLRSLLSSSFLLPVWLPLKAAEMFMDKGWQIDGRTREGPSEILHQRTCSCISVYVLVATGQSSEIRFSNLRWNVCYFVSVAVSSSRAGTLAL